MKPYVSLLRVRFLNGLQYRAAALGGLATQFFWGLMLVFIYKAFYGDAVSSNGFSYKDLVTYIWLGQAFLSFTMLYDWDSEMLEMITTGGISYELCRPVQIYNVWYVRLLSKRLSRGLLRFAPVLVLGFVMPYPYNMSLPQSPLSLLLFLITLLLGLLLLVAISMLIYISVFYTLSPLGVRLIAAVCADFLAGAIIPLPFFPDSVRQVAELLPFAAMQNMPLRIYSGNIAGMDIIYGFGLQLFWLAFMVLVGRFAMSRALRKVVVQGG